MNRLFIINYFIIKLFKIKKIIKYYYKILINLLLLMDEWFYEYDKETFNN